MPRETIMFIISDIRFRRTFAAAAVALAGFTAGCGDDDIAEPDVQTIRLVVGANTYDIDAGAVVPVTIMIGRTANAVSATFLRPNGQPETLVNATEFELRLDGLSNIATFTRTGAFTGTLTGVTVGTDTDVAVRLFHLEEMHADFEKTVTVQVN
jgi:hypothetical protein